MQIKKASNIFDVIKPFISLSLVIGTLLTVVFVKMEGRRLGYNVLKLTRMEKKLGESRREKNLHFARLTRPGRIEQIAKNRLELKQPGRGQIVQLFVGEGTTALSRVQ